ncbi:hypothetical protein AB0G05_20185 [Nonomuraea wenchangensis]
MAAVDDRLDAPARTPGAVRPDPTGTDITARAGAAAALGRTRRPPWPAA